MDKKLSQLSREQKREERMKNWLTGAGINSATPKPKGCNNSALPCLNLLYNLTPPPKLKISAVSGERHFISYQRQGRHHTERKIEDFFASAINWVTSERGQE